MLVFLCGIGSAQAAAPKTVLVLGDSLSAAHNIPVEAGWVHLLDARLNQMVPKWTAINASISGETSLSGRNRLPALLAKYRPQVLVLELGANDGLRGLPLPALRANLDAMIAAAQKAKVRVLLTACIRSPAPSRGCWIPSGSRCSRCCIERQTEPALNLVFPLSRYPHPVAA